MLKDPALSLLWLEFDPWPRNFCMLQVCPSPPKKIQITFGNMIFTPKPWLYPKAHSVLGKEMTTRVGLIQYYFFLLL